MKIPAFSYNRKNNAFYQETVEKPALASTMFLTRVPRIIVNNRKQYKLVTYDSILFMILSNRNRQCKQSWWAGLDFLAAALHPVAQKKSVYFFTYFSEESPGAGELFGRFATFT